MINVPTGELMDKLKSGGRPALEKQLAQNPSEPNFEAYFNSIINDWCEKNDASRLTLFMRAGINEKRGYKIIEGTRTANRDYLLRMFYVLGMDLTKVQRALELYGMPVLYPKVRRDAVLITAFNENRTNIDEVNQMLNDYGEAELEN